MLKVVARSTIAICSSKFLKSALVRSISVLPIIALLQRNKKTPDIIKDHGSYEFIAHYLREGITTFSKTLPNVATGVVTISSSSPLLYVYLNRTFTPSAIFTARNTHEA